MTNYQRETPIRSKEALYRSLQDLRTIVPINKNLAQKSSLSVNDLSKYLSETPITAEASKSSIKQALKSMASKVTNSPKFLYQNPTINAVVAPFTTQFKSLYEHLKWIAGNPIISFIVQTTLFSVALTGANTDTSNFATIDSINQLQNSTIIALETNTQQIETLYDTLAYLSTNLGDKMPEPISSELSEQDKINKLQQEILIQRALNNNLALVGGHIQEKYKTNFSASQLKDFGQHILHKFALTELFANEPKDSPLEKMNKEYGVYVDLVYDDTQKALNDQTFLQNYPSILNSQEYQNIYDSINSKNGNLNDLHNLQEVMMAESKNKTLDILLEDVINRPSLYLDKKQIQEISKPEKQTKYLNFDPYDRLTKAPDPLIQLLKRKLCQYLQTNLTSTDYNILFSQPPRKKRF